MTTQEFTQKVNELQKRRNRSLVDVLNVLKPAYAQMVDANMKEGALPLGQLIHEIEKVEQEIVELMKADPLVSIEAMMGMIEKRVRD